MLRAAVALVVAIGLFAVMTRGASAATIAGEGQATNDQRELEPVGYEAGFDLAYEAGLTGTQLSEHVTMTNNPEANLRAFLAAIRAGEGTSGPNGYRTLFGGGLFDSFEDHPRIVVAATLAGKPIRSSAAGAYQILQKTWDWIKAKGPLLPDFSPESQDEAARRLIEYRGGLQAVYDGRLADAVNACRKEWASLPGAGYGQPEKSFASVQAVYLGAGGNIA